MATYILSKATACKMCEMWFSLGLSFSDVDRIHSVFGIFTVFDSSQSGTVKALRELNACDEVRVYVTPGAGSEDQEKIIRYGNILCAIINAIPASPNKGFRKKPKFVFIYE